MSGACVLTDVLQEAMRSVRERLDADSITGLVQALQAAEERLRIDLYLELHSDGSGCVMAPRTRPVGPMFRPIHDFADVAGLTEWLRVGELAEDAGDETRAPMELAHV